MPVHLSHTQAKKDNFFNKKKTTNDIGSPEQPNKKTGMITIKLVWHQQNIHISANIIKIEKIAFLLILQK